MGEFYRYLFGITMSVTAIFLILLVLVQRGRGGGLAGAFGGAGGQSAFGTKAGDLFTRITIGAATFWIILCALSVKLISADSSKVAPDIGKKQAASTEPGQSTDKRPGVTGAKSTKKDSTKKEAPATDSPAAEPAAETPAATPPAETPGAEAPATTPPAESK